MNKNTLGHQLKLQVMNKKIISAIFVVLVIFSLAYIFLSLNPEILTNLMPNNNFLCQKDTDCVSVCGSCENITYFHSNPPSTCSTPVNQTGSRSCFCVNNQCTIRNATTQPSFIQPQSSQNFNYFYILIGIVIFIVFILFAVFISRLMDSPPEMWLF